MQNINIIKIFIISDNFEKYQNITILSKVNISIKKIYIWKKTYIKAYLYKKRHINIFACFCMFFIIV